VRTIPFVVCPRLKVRFCGRCVEETDPGEERCDTVLVMFWQNGLTMRTE
jgi:hypothetical protein